MLVKTIGKNVDVSNTSLIGYVEIKYEDLVKAFGKPTSQRPSGDDKVRIEWDIKFADDTIATIYDYKNYGKSIKWVKENCKEWHIGGNNKFAVDNVLNVIKDKKIKFNRLTFD